MNSSPVLTPLQRVLLCVGSAFAVLPLTVSAQSAPAKSTATPPQIVLPSAPAKSGPRTLAGKAPVGKMLSRDELRACLKRLDDFNAASKDLESQRTALDQEKDELARAGDALKAERADVDARTQAVKQWQERVKAHGAAIEAYNQRVKAANESKPADPQALAKELDAERQRLNDARGPLAEEETRLLPAYENAVKTYNEKAKARDARVDDWNARNRALNERAGTQETERSAWLSECADRPYREDDEIAIKRGR